MSAYLAPELYASVPNLLAVGVSLRIPLVRVLVADDFAPWRRLLHTILREKPELQVVCEVSDGLEAVQKARELQPDLILLDIGLPTISGIEAARRIRSIAPRAKILFVSENYSIDIARGTLSAGGCGYVIKSDAGSELLAAVEAVFLGKQFVSARLTGQSISGAANS
jgi:DNA-binding NarL/FixJ family response regulator